MRSDVVRDWFAGDPTMWDACFERPEVAWAAILELVDHDLTEDQTALLAAGPLETLLATHGANFIERVEQQARDNPRFSHLLGGVWRSEMPLEIWERVESSRQEVW